MKRITILGMALALLMGVIIGFCLGGSPRAAFAQAPEPPQAEAPNITALVQPPIVVAALPYQTQTDYEQDPFEPSRVRRTTSQIRRVLFVYQDGKMEIKDAP